jgi:hypothetical protein
MEKGRMMVVHALVIGVLLYVLMVYVLKQNPMVAENRSILLAGVVLVYMILFGHGMPNRLNPHL